MMREAEKLEYDILTAWVDQAQIGLAVFDDTNTVVMVNRSLCLQWGILGSDVTDKPAPILFRQVNETDALINWLVNSLYGEREATRIGGSATTKTFRLKATQVKYSSDVAFKVMAVTDITDLQLARAGSVTGRTFNA